MRFILTMTVLGVVGLLGIIVADNNMHGSRHDVDQRLKEFRHWTVKSYWTDPEIKTFTVLLTEDAVSGTDTACDGVLDMLDKLTQLEPSWVVKLMSPTDWIPSRINPLSRADVEDIIINEPYKGMAFDAKWDKRAMEIQQARGRSAQDYNE